MTEITVNAYAKVNLTLDVTGKLPNGYHELKMIMQSIDLHDTLTIRRAEVVSMTCSDPALAIDGGNLVIKAANAFFSHTGIDGGAAIHLEKRIPIAAGLAGGSADAAAVLKGLNSLYSAELSEDELCDIGVNLGADVPFCIVGGTKMCEGIGEKISPLPPMPDCFILLAKPDFPVSTPQVYKAIDNISYEHLDNDGAVEALKNGDLSALCEKMSNVLELVTGAEHREIAELCMEMDSLGAVKSMMSGSGPTVFGVFADAAAVKSAEQSMQRASLQVMLTRPLN